MIRAAFVGNKEERKTILEALAWHNEMFQQKVKAGTRVPRSFSRFKTTVDKLKAFFKYQYKISDMPLANIKAAFAEDFAHYLMVVDKLEHNTAMKYVSNVKKVLGIAAQKEWIPRNPINDFKCTYYNPERNVLQEADLKRMIEKKMPVKRLEEVRDCFILMCYTGFAYNDAASLSPDDIKLMIDGNRWLVKPRTKTNVRESVPILPMVETLINKYSTHPYCIANNKLFPFNSNQKMNAYLKEVGDICKLPFPLTTHLARHTFATSITLANGVPLETVQVLLGHRSIRTTQIYAKVLGKKVSDDMALLKIKLTETCEIKKVK
ncbi:MAG: site-specific integrase [Bacteroidota bacterium]